MKILKYQEGGQIPAQTEAVEAQQGTDPIIQIAQVMAQAIQSGDCNMAMQACQAFLSLLQQVNGNAQEPISNEPEGQPVFKKGGKIVKRKKCKK